MSQSHCIILVADDEVAVRNMIATIARRTGCRILLAKNGVDALKLSRRFEGRIDMLISDIQMPKMNGVELASQLTVERPGIQVLLVSGAADVDVPPSFHLLLKPFPVATMRKTMADLLAHRN